MGKALAKIIAKIPVVFQKKIFSRNSIISQIWLSSGLVLSLLNFCLPITAMKPFWYGIYLQAEPVNNAFWVLGIAVGSWLLWTYKMHPILIRYALRMPIVYGTGLLALLSMVLSVFHINPLLTWYGSARLGEGAIGFLVQAFLAALFMILCRFSRMRKTLLYCAFVLGSMICFFSFIGSRDSPILSLRNAAFAPYYFPDWFAYIGLSFIPIFAVWYQSRFWRSPKSYRLFLGYGLLVTIFFAIVWMAENKSFTYGLCIATALMLSLKAMFKTSEKIQKALYFTAFGIAIGFVVIIACYGLIVPEAKVNTTLSGRSVLMRFIFLQFLANFTLLEWWYTLIGHGWGTLSEVIMQNVFLVPEISIFSGETFTPYQENLKRDFFHNHNRIAENFLSTGILGTVSLFYVFYLLIKSFKKEKIFLAGIFLLGYILLDSFWFQFTASVPYSILGFCVLTNPISHGFSNYFITVFKKPVWVYSIGIVSIFTLGGFAAFSLYTALSFNQISKVDYEEDFLGKLDYLINHRSIQNDNYFGNKRATLLIRSQSAANLIATQKHKGFSKKQLFELNLKAARYLEKTSKSCKRLESCAVALNIYGELSTEKGVSGYFKEDKNAFLEWKNLAKLFLKRAPNRADMLIPYLNYTIVRDQKTRAWEMIDSILMQKPQDPVGLWYSGTLKLADRNSFQRGLEELQASLTLGINRFVPISEAQKKRILEHPSA